MELEQLLEKMAKGERLNPLERRELREEARALTEIRNLAQSWVFQGTSIPIFVPPMVRIYPVDGKALGANMTSLTIPIPGDYSHLEIHGNGRSSAATSGTVFLQFNGDTTVGNYQWTYVLGNGTVASSGQDISDPHIPIGQFSNSGDAAGSASSFFCRIPHYTSSFTKMTLSETYYNDNISRDLYHIGGKWISTAKINSLEIYVTDNTSIKGTSNIVAGSLISVYGVR